MIKTALRATARKIFSIVFPRVAVIESPLARLEAILERLAVMESRLARLESTFVTSPESTGEIHPLSVHTAQAINMLSTGVAIAYACAVEGEIAEFGTMSGATAKGLARAIALCDRYLGYALTYQNLPPKQLHLFDSFEGLPPADNPVDGGSPHVRAGVWGPGTCKGLSQKELFSLVSKELDPARIKIFAGWFSDTLKTLPAGTRYALVHIDSDLYSSARDVLNHLFANQMIAPGGQIFFDDWNCNAASPQFGERRAWSEALKKWNIDASDEGAYGFGHKFIVHSYDGLIDANSASKDRG